MQREYPGIRMHLGYYGPRVSDEPIAQMKPRLAGCEIEASPCERQTSASTERRSRVEISTEVDN